MRQNQKGQVVLILVLVMTVALAIGVSVIQRSLSDVSTASKIEQSSRAFSAAEAGIEKAIQSNNEIAQAVTLDNNAVIQSVSKNDAPDPNVPGQALEYPELSKEEVAQVWLVKPEDLSSPYSGSSLTIYWGNEGVSGAEQPAIEVTLIYKSGSNYLNRKYYLDAQADIRGSGFDKAVTCPSADVIKTSLSPTVDKKFACKKDISLTGLSSPIMLRARLLYNNTPQAFAVKPSAGASLPVQAKVFVSTGTAGKTQRTVRVFRLDKVAPSFLDYAIFSVGNINK